MKIGIDISQTAFPGSGVARYTHNLVTGLLQHNTHNTYSFLYTSLRKPPPREILELIDDPHQLFHYPIPPTVMSWLWNSLHKVPAEWFVEDIDVFISSDWTQPPTRSAKKVTIVHDLIPYVFPETSTTKTSFSLGSMRISANIVETQKKRLSWVKKECDMIIADSQSTKKDLVEILNIPDEKINVVYPAVSVPEVTLSDVQRVQDAYSPRKPYILTVGKVEPRKNIRRLIKAFAQSELFTTYDLLIVGAKGWGDGEIDIPQKVQEAVVFAGFVPDEDLYPLYKGAAMFVMPSLYEGFGYPALEAMSLGCPVATSSTSSLGELIEGHGITFDPTRIKDITEAMVDLSKKKRESQALEKAQKYARSFTHQKFALTFQDHIQKFA